MNDETKTRLDKLIIKLVDLGAKYPGEKDFFEQLADNLSDVRKMTDEEVKELRKEINDEL